MLKLYILFFVSFFFALFPAEYEPCFKKRLIAIKKLSDSERIPDYVQMARKEVAHMLKTSSWAHEDIEIMRDIAADQEVTYIVSRPRLMIAIQSGDIAVIQDILKKCPELQIYPLDNDENAFKYACSSGNENSVLFFIEKVQKHELQKMLCDEKINCLFWLQNIIEFELLKREFFDCGNDPISIMMLFVVQKNETLRNALKYALKKPTLVAFSQALRNCCIERGLRRS